MYQAKAKWKATRTTRRTANLIKLNKPKMAHSSKLPKDWRESKAILL